jgi:uncharacterized protein
METLHPGTYLQEIPGEKPVEGTSTSVAGFVGVASKGQVGKAITVSSWNEFLNKLGGYINDSYLAYAVRGFFENGGSQAVISRVVHYDSDSKTSVNASVTIQASSTPTIVVDALSDGTYGNDLSFQILNVEGETFDVYILHKKNVVESFEGVNLPELEDLLAGSQEVKLTVLDETQNVVAGTHKLDGGENGLTGLVANDYIKALDALDKEKINFISAPGATDVAVIQGLLAYADKRKDCGAILEPPMGKTPSTVKEFVNTMNAFDGRSFFYNTWIRVSDPIGVGKNPTKLIPPSGHIAGVYARTDTERGVWKAPAGINAVIRGALGLEYNVSDVEQDQLNPLGINCLRAFSGEGIVVWGARTLAKDPEFRYISTRRNHDFIGQSLVQGSRWSVFEPNGQELWDKLKSSSEAFLREHWRAGGLAGASEEEAFFVNVGADTTSPEAIAQGKVFAEVGVAHQNPAEFVVFRLSMRN